MVTLSIEESPIYKKSGETPWVALVLRRRKYFNNFVHITRRAPSQERLQVSIVSFSCWYLWEEKLSDGHTPVTETAPKLFDLESISSSKAATIKSRDFDAVRILWRQPNWCYPRQPTENFTRNSSYRRASSPDGFGSSQPTPEYRGCSTVDKDPPVTAQCSPRTSNVFLKWLSSFVHSDKVNTLPLPDGKGHITQHESVFINISMDIVLRSQSKHNCNTIYKSYWYPSCSLYPPPNR